MARFLPPYARVTSARPFTLDKHGPLWIEIYLRLGGKQAQREQAIADLGSAAGGLGPSSEPGGQDRLSLYHWPRLGWSELLLNLAPDLGVSPPALAVFLHQLLTGIGVRSNTLCLLNFELDPNYADPRHYAIPADWAKLSYATVTKALTMAQQRWGTRLFDYLALDEAGGTQTHAPLVAEIHLGLAPLEHAMARCLLENIAGMRPDKIDFAGNFPFEKVPAGQMLRAGASLEAAGWIEDFELSPNPPWNNSRGLCYRAKRGPKLRRLTASDLLFLGYPS